MKNKQQCQCPKCKRKISVALRDKVKFTPKCVCGELWSDFELINKIGAK